MATAEQKAAVKQAVWNQPSKGETPVEVLSENQNAGALADENQTEAEYHTFYSTAACLVISADKGRRALVDGEMHRIDEKIIEFVPQANHYGMYRTNDPDIVRYLELRAKKVGDVLTPADYNDRILRPEDKIRNLQNENKRIIEEQNRLLSMLKAQEISQK